MLRWDVFRVSREKNNQSLGKVEMGAGLQAPSVKILYEGHEAVVLPNLPKRLTADEIVQRTASQKRKIHR
jgi:hypothetical protein